MKSEINLITPEFKEASQISWPRTVGMIAAVVLIVSIVGVAIFLPSRIYSVESDVETLEERIEDKQKAYREYYEIKDKIEVIEHRYNVGQQLKALQTPFSDYLGTMKGVSNGEVTILHIDIDEDKEVEIEGRGTSLQNIALYLRDMDDLEFLSLVYHSYMEMEEEDAFEFEATARMD